MLAFYNACTDQEKQEIRIAFKDYDGVCFQGIKNMRAHIANFNCDDFEEWKTFLEDRFPDAFWGMHGKYVQQALFKLAKRKWKDYFRHVSKIEENI